MFLGNGLLKVVDCVFWIGYLGDFNDLMLCGMLVGVEMGFVDVGVFYRFGGVMVVMNVLCL